MHRTGNFPHPVQRSVVFIFLFFGLIDDVAPVQIAAVKTEDEHFSRCRIGSDRDVVHIAQSCDRVDIRLVLRVGHRIAEKQHKVDLVVKRRARRSAPRRPACRPGTCRSLRPVASSTNLPVVPVAQMLCFCKNTAVCHAKLYHQFFLRSCAISAMFISKRLLPYPHGWLVSTSILSLCDG